MDSRLLTSFSAILALIHPDLAGIDCRPTTISESVPGRWDQPVCGSVIASDLGPGVAYSFDYRNCGGINFLLLPSTIF